MARPKEQLPTESVGDYKVEWLANDVAAFTYQTTENTIKQFIGTYGDRKNGLAYYNVEAEIHGVWEGANVKLKTAPEGIMITENNEAQLFTWDSMEQFGTLALVLMQDDEAVWTVSLNEKFEVHSDARTETNGNIALYKATMGKSELVKLHDENKNEAIIKIDTFPYDKYTYIKIQKIPLS